MFGIFKKSRYPTESKWSVLQGEHDGRPMIVRRNDSAGQLRGNSSFRFRVGIAVPIKEPDERGLPSSEETAHLNAIEDALSSALEQNQRSLQALVITTSGMREFVFYSCDPAFAQSVLESNVSFSSGHEVQSYIAEDPDWSVYAQFA